MAGSLRNFQYVADDGQIYLFKADESNVESVNLLVANIVTANANRPGIPRNVTPRRVYYSNADRTRTLGIIASTQAIYLAPPATIPDTLPSSTAVLSLSRKTPERVRLFSNIDTGLTDGDAPL
jgi:hypothetical protein